MHREQVPEWCTRSNLFNIPLRPRHRFNHCRPITESRCSQRRQSRAAAKCTDPSVELMHHRRPYAPLRQYQNVIAGPVAAPRFDGLYKQMRAPLIAERPSARTVMMAKRERERLLGTSHVKIAVLSDDNRRACILEMPSQQMIWPVTIPDNEDIARARL